MKARAELEAAIQAQDPDEFENALNDLGDGAGCGVLIQALSMDWHFRHEDVALAIQWARCADAVPALEARALDCPAYLAWDDNHALARKCTWALADIGTPEARAALERLADCDIAVVGELARRRLDRWQDELHRKR